MTYLTLSRLLFWAFIGLMFAASMTWLVIHERLDRRLEVLAEEHRRKRRVERFNNLSQKHYQ
jgi:heme exporter protein D